MHVHTKHDSPSAKSIPTFKHEIKSKSPHLYNFNREILEDHISIEDSIT
jgi:hypothetical protein